MDDYNNIIALQMAACKYLALAEDIKQGLSTPLPSFQLMPGGVYSEIVPMYNSNKKRYFIFNHFEANKWYRCAIIACKSGSKYAFLVVDTQGTVIYITHHLLQRFKQRSFHPCLKVNTMDLLRIFLYNVFEYTNNYIGNTCVLGQLGVVRTVRGDLACYNLEYTGFITYLSQSQLTKSQQIALGFVSRYPNP